MAVLILLLQLVFVFTYAAVLGPSAIYDINDDLLEFDTLSHGEATPSVIQDISFANWEVVSPLDSSLDRGSFLHPPSTFQAIRVANNTMNGTIASYSGSTEYDYGFSAYSVEYSAHTLSEASMTITSLFFGCALPTTNYKMMTPISCMMNVAALNCHGKQRAPFKYTFSVPANTTAANMIKATFPTERYHYCSNYELWATPINQSDPTPVLYIDNLSARLRYRGYANHF